MKIIGISGQTGAGKSALADMLMLRGLGKNLEVDAVGHKLLDDEKIKLELAQVFGKDIIDNNGKVCRRTLGRKAFVSEESISLLNSIMHPAMITEVKKELDQAQKMKENFFIINAALLFSMKLDQFCDELIYVVTSPAIRLKRLIEYRSWSEDVAKERLFAQDEMPEGRGIIVVKNNGSELDLATEADKLASKLTKKEGLY